MFLTEIGVSFLQRVSVIHMSEDEIIDLLSSHGINKRSAEPEPEPTESEEPESQGEERQEL